MHIIECENAIGELNVLFVILASGLATKHTDFDIGGETADRTRDLQNFSLLLSQLSYSPYAFRLTLAQ